MTKPRESRRNNPIEQNETSKDNRDKVAIKTNNETLKRQHSYTITIALEANRLSQQFITYSLKIYTPRG